MLFVLLFTINTLQVFAVQEPDFKSMISTLLISVLLLLLKNLIVVFSV